MSQMVNFRVPTPICDGINNLHDKIRRSLCGRNLTLLNAVASIGTILNDQSNMDLP